MAFVSEATNLDPAKTDAAVTGVFLRDLREHTTTLVSRASDGAAGRRRRPAAPAISADGRVVAFESDATNLAAGDTDELTDVFARDVAAGTTALVSGPGADPRTGSSTQPAISADGTTVAFSSTVAGLDPRGPADPLSDVFTRNLATGALTLVSRSDGADGEKGNDASDSPAISGDGRVVAFSSTAANLDPADLDNVTDVFVRDLARHTTAVVSLGDGPTGGKGDADSTAPALSQTGRFVAFSLAQRARPRRRGRARRRVLARRRDRKDAAAQPRRRRARARRATAPPTRRRSPRTRASWPSPRRRPTSIPRTPTRSPTSSCATCSARSCRWRAPPPRTPAARDLAGPVPRGAGELPGRRHPDGADGRRRPPHAAAPAPTSCSAAADRTSCAGCGGRDCLYGERGADRLVGGAGDDLLSGGAGADRLTDARGSDRFSGGAGNDVIDARDSSRRDRRRRDRVSCGAGSRDRALVDATTSWLATASTWPKGR